MKEPYPESFACATSFLLTKRVCYQNLETGMFYIFARVVCNTCCIRICHAALTMERVCWNFSTTNMYVIAIKYILSN